jgi:hypothetical protein
LKIRFLSAFFGIASLAHAASSVNLTVAQLRDASGTVIPDAAPGTWAIIVAGVEGLPAVSGTLPGGLTDGSSLTAAQASQIAADFDGLTLTVGSQGTYTIHQLGIFDSGEDGAVLATINFDIASSPNPGFDAGTLWGLYWFPGVSAGATLSGNFEVGGFAQSTANIESGGDEGTVIPGDGLSVNVNFIETNFNQTVLEGGDTGLSAARFTAVAVPEPSVFGLAGVFGIAGLLLRRR